MQLPEPPPPPLAPLWDRVLRARALPPDLDVQLLYIAIRDRLTHAEWEVRLHALRVLADLLPLSGNALSFPFDQVVDNLGHSSPNVRKAALDALKVFCDHCEDTECAARAITDKCFYHNIRPHSANVDTKVNVVTGLLLSLPSMMTILKRRQSSLNMYPVFQILGEKLYDHVHKDIALRSLLKFRKVCGQREFTNYISSLDTKVQDKFRYLCENYDEDSLDVYYAPRKSYNNNNQQLVNINHVFNSPTNTPIRLTTESSSEESSGRTSLYNNNFAKVIIETEIKFNSETAITMTVLEENETESDKCTISEDDYDSSERNMLKFSDADSDTDVVVKKVRFGGESVKIRTPDSDNIITSEEDNKIQNTPHKNLIERAASPNVSSIVNKINDVKLESISKESQHVNKTTKKSAIPLPVIKTKPRKIIDNSIEKPTQVKLKSKSLSELYDFFRTKNEFGGIENKESRFALTLAEVRSPEKIPSPVQYHREVEVLHNLQRSPVVSPRRRRRTRLHLEHNGFTLKLLASSLAHEQDFLSPRPPTPLQERYAWEELDVIPRHLAEQLHNTENWISAVKAADQLHSALLKIENVKKMEPAALSFVQHMWALGDAVSATRAPTESAVCALIRGASNNCARHILPNLISRMCRDPAPAALPHALLQRLALHHIVDLIFDASMTGETDKDLVEIAQLKGTLCLARAAGPAAVLSAVRRRLAGTARVDSFCNEIRDRLSRPSENIRTNLMSRISQLPVAVRRRARSTPPPAAPAAPRRLRPLPESAPLLGISPSGLNYLFKPLSPIPWSDRDSSAFTKSYNDKESDKDDDLQEKEKLDDNLIITDITDLSITADSRFEESPPQSTRQPSTPAHQPLTQAHQPSTPAHQPSTPARAPSSPARAPSSPARPLRSPSIRVDDYSEKSKSNPSIYSAASLQAESLKSKASSLEETRSQNSLKVVSLESLLSRPASRSPSPRAPSRSRSTPSSPARSEHRSPRVTRTRDVRAALAECALPAKHEDWQAVVAALAETERLAEDTGARASAISWRGSARAAAAHVRSLRSRVARAACRTLGALFEHRGRALEPELEEGAAALLDRCADVNRFLRADAASALVRVACGGGLSRAVGTLSRRGVGHRAGPARAAAALALSRLVARWGAARALSMGAEVRTALVRAAGELVGDASAEVRVHGRHLFLALSQDDRFHSLLKASMSPSKYLTIEKYVDKLS